MRDFAITCRKHAKELAMMAEEDRLRVIEEDRLREETQERKRREENSNALFSIVQGKDDL